MSNYFCAGWNMPGYLPEMEIQEYENLKEAKDFLISELESAIDNIDPDKFIPYADELFQEGIKEINSWKTENNTSVMPDGYVYFIQLGQYKFSFLEEEGK